MSVCIIKIILSPSILEPVSISKGLRKKKEILKYFFLNQLNLRLKYGTLKKKEKKTVVRTFN